MTATVLSCLWVHGLLCLTLQISSSAATPSGGWGVCGQIGRLGTMGSEEICLNQEVKMQAAAFKDKKQRAPDHKEGADPDYENITLTFRNQEQPRGSHSPPKNRGKQPPASPHLTASGGAPVPAWSKPAPDSAQVPRWLHRATLSLYILLALFCIVLLALVLVKNSEVSQELLVVKRELQNVSTSGHQCQEEQKQGWSSIQQLISEARQDLDTIKRSVHVGNEKAKTLSTDLSQIKTKLHEISKILEKKPQPQPTAQ